MPKVSVITPSFNKVGYVKDAIDSVMAQTMQDFEYYIVENSTDPETRKKVKDVVKEYNDPRIHYEEENFTDEDRKEIYPTTVILNKYYEVMKGEYFFYISDDDTIEPTALEKMCMVLDAQPGTWVVFHSQKSLKGGHDIGWVDNGTKKAEQIVRAGQKVDCVLDGGQVMFRRECLKQLSKPYWVESADWNKKSHCDGIFLDRLSAKWDFYPINEVLSYHRKTRHSNFDKHE